MSALHNNGQVRGDRPTSNDKLGFAEPAARLADKITHFPRREPMVVGIEGKWGEGKSSFLLMMKKRWRKQARLAPKGFCANFCQFLQEKVREKKPVRQIKLIEFDPWWFSGKDNLLDKLLKELEGQEPWWHPKLRGLLKSLEKQANAENKWVSRGVNAVALGFASGVSAVLNIIFNGSSGNELSSMSSWLQDSRMTAALVLVLFWAIKLLLKQFIAWLSPPEGFDARKKKLEALLKKDRFQRVVFVDDLDRLPADELQEMFRVIKSVANFPNVVYVLAYDREVVSTALDKFHSGRGEYFIEKIVQISIAIPTPEESAIQKLHQKIFSRSLDMRKFFNTMDANPVLRKCWELIQLNFIKTTRQSNRLYNLFFIGFTTKIGMSPIYFLFLEALRLHNKNLHAKVCAALMDITFISQVQTVVAPDDKNALNLQKDIGLDKIQNKEAACIAFFIGIPFEGKQNTGLHTIFFSDPNNFNIVRANQDYRNKTIQEIMFGYMKSVISEELNTLIRLAEEILAINDRENPVEFMNNINLNTIPQALYAKLAQPTSDDEPKEKLALMLRNFIIFLAEQFENCYDSPTINDHAKTLQFIDKASNFIYQSNLSKKYMIISNEANDAKYIKQFPLFFSKYCFTAACSQFIWQKYPPSFFIRHTDGEQYTYNWLLVIIIDTITQYNPSDEEKLKNWIEQLPEVGATSSDNHLSPLEKAIAIGFSTFLQINHNLPEILHHKKIQHLITHIEYECRENINESNIFEKFKK